MDKQTELATRLAAAEAALADDFNRLAYPNGREEAWNRINAMCELSPASIGEGPIERSPNLHWKTTR